MNRPTRKPPISEGDEVDVRIESIGDKGDGVARVQGFVIFVPSVQKGDWVKVKVKKVLEKVSFGEKIKDIEPPANGDKPRPQLRPKDEFDDIDLENLGEGSEEF